MSSPLGRLGRAWLAPARSDGRSVEEFEYAPWSLTLPSPARLAHMPVPAAAEVLSTASRRRGGPTSSPPGRRLPVQGARQISACPTRLPGTVDASNARSVSRRRAEGLCERRRLAPKLRGDTRLVGVGAGSKLHRDHVASIGHVVLP